MIPHNPNVRKRGFTLGARLFVAIIALALLSVAGYAFYQASNSKTPVSFGHEFERINFKGEAIAAGYHEGCTETGSLGPATRVCVGRSEKVFKSSGDTCADFRSADQSLQAAGYVLSYDTKQSISVRNPGKSPDICAQLKNADSKNQSQTFLDILTYSRGKDSINTGQYYVQCQFGTAIHPYGYDGTLKVPTSPAIADRTAAYGCILQHNL